MKMKLDDSDTYTIMIDEEQRLQLLAMLRKVQIDPDSDEQILIDMLDELPEIEDTHKVVHGFCL